MKTNFTLFLLSFAYMAFAQNGAPANPYYNGSNWTLTGMNLKNALATKITNTHTNFLSYGNVWDASQATDLDPTDASNANVLLLYGFSAGICPAAAASDNDHRKRDKFSNGGGTSCQWNREHVFAKALGNPTLDDGGSSDAGEDAHHLRACDVDRNNSRGSLKFITGSGNSTATNGGWYPGDEWKGDVARMIMYMYLRYPTQCLPKNVGFGTVVTTDTNMIQLFLQWNAEDPVSAYEDNRNTYHGNTSNSFAQGNRNPFIDNPYLATLIWGGPVAQNRWPTTILETTTFASIENSLVYPNPTSNNEIMVEAPLNISSFSIFNIGGQLIMELKNPEKLQNNTYKIGNIPSGFYFLKINSEQKSTTKKITVH